MTKLLPGLKDETFNKTCWYCTTVNNYECAHANTLARTTAHIYTCGFLQTFLELIELAKQGNPSAIDIVSSDLKATSNTVDTYSALEVVSDVTLGHFGKVMFNPAGKPKTCFVKMFLNGVSDV